jgi:hypothetical protein
VSDDQYAKLILVELADGAWHTASEIALSLCGQKMAAQIDSVELELQFQQRAGTVQFNAAMRSWRTTR